MSPRSRPQANFSLDVLVAFARNEALFTVLEESAPDLIASLIVLLKSPLTVLRAQRCLRAVVDQIVTEEVLPCRALLPEVGSFCGRV